MVGPLSDGSGNLSAYEVEQAIGALQFEMDNLSFHLTNVALANPVITEALTSSPKIPKISGIRAVDSAPFVITFAWDASTLSNLLRYDIYIDTDAGFSNPIIIPWTGIEYSYSVPKAVDPDTEVPISYYIKVRAVDNQKVVGEFSNILNGTTGLVTTELLDPHSSSMLAYESYSSFSPASISGDGASATYGGLVVTTIGRPLFIFVEAICEITSQYMVPNNGNLYMETTLLCDSVPVGIKTYTDFTVYTDDGYGTPTAMTGAVTISFPNPVYEGISAGTHTFSILIELTAYDTNVLSVTPIFMDITALEIRR